MQNHYNLLYREEEREMLPLCADQGVGVIPWSPLARGRLTRAWDAADAAVGDRRVRPQRSTATIDRPIVDAVTRRRPAARRRPSAGRPGLGAHESRGYEPDRRGDETTNIWPTRSPRWISFSTTPEIERLEKDYRPHGVDRISVATPLRKLT